MAENFKRLLAHKLGNLVMLAHNPVELLEMPDLPDDQRVQLRAMLLDSLERMGQICRDLTDLGRAEELDQEPLVEFQLDLSAAHIAQQFYDSAPDGVQISYREPAMPLGTLVGQPELVERAIEKLLENAVQFSPGGGQIIVDVLADEGNGIVRVTDPGVGIPLDAQPFIFEPFYRVKDHVAQQLPGLGLGLSVAQAIAQAHQGCITVRSTPGEGSEFMLKLPFNQMVQ